MISELNVAQEAFVTRYNPSRSAEEAVRRAKIASLQRNRTYSSAATSQQRRQVHYCWSEALVGLATNYDVSRSLGEFKADAESLRERMNLECGGVLCPGGFRVSHAQKSLAVYLKHLWCLGRVCEPPSCPVDRIVLTLAEAPVSLRAWTTVDSWELYDQQLGFIRSKAAGESQTLAVWELVHFHM